MIKILIADDEARIRKIVHDFLHCKGYQVVEASDGEEAFDIFTQDKNISLVVLDVMMPKMDGWEVLRKIRESSAVPVIMLTAKSEEDDELYGFDLGADEYITKPFSPKILVARVDALLKRNQSITGKSRQVGNIEINKNARTVKVLGEDIILSFKEFELLTYFIDNQNLALSRNQILNSVWNFDYFGDARTIDTHVKKLRSKLLSCGNYIKTVRGVGYKFEVEKDV